MKVSKLIKYLDSLEPSLEVEGEITFTGRSFTYDGVNSGRIDLTVHLEKRGSKQSARLKKVRKRWKKK